MAYEYNGNEFLKRLQAVAGNKTQSALAADLGITQGTVSKWKNSPPSGRDLIGIVETYNCSTDYLLGIETPKTTDSPAAYPDFLRCVIAIVENHLGYVTKYDTGDTEAFQTGPEEWEETPKLKTALVLDNVTLDHAIRNYDELRTVLQKLDEPLRHQLFAMWKKNEMNKDVELSKAGMAAYDFS